MFAAVSLVWSNPTFTVEPRTVTIGGDALTVTTPSPEYVTLECRMTSVQMVYSIYIKRGAAQNPLGMKLKIESHYIT